MTAVLLGKKIEMSSRFDRNGQRLPVTLIEAGPCLVAKFRTVEKDGYQAVQLGFGRLKSKKEKKPDKGQFKDLPYLPKVAREFRVEEDGLKVGQEIKVDVFSPGDQVKISGISKGKGFAGVMKRWGFAGGPATHGQSDRARAPGSIGSTTTPGRVLKGKKMAGHLGLRQVTVKGLAVVEVSPEKNLLVVSGSIPGARGTLLEIVKTGEAKKDTSLPESPREEESIKEKSEVVEAKVEEEKKETVGEETGEGKQNELREDQINEEEKPVEKSKEDEDEENQS